MLDSVHSDPRFAILMRASGSGDDLKGSHFARFFEKVATSVDSD